MDELIQTVCQKVGISPEQAKQAVETVMTYVKEKGISLDQITAGGGLGDIAKNIGGLFGKK